MPKTPTPPRFLQILKADWSRHAWRRELILVVLLILFVFNAFNPVLQFSSPAVGDCAALMFWLIPGLLVLNSLALPSRAGKYLFATIFALLVFIGTMVIPWQVAFLLADIYGPRPLSKEIAAVDYGHSRVVAHLADPGAMGSSAIVVLQEKPVLPGLLLVRRLHIKRRSDEIELLKADDDRVMIDGLPYDVPPFVYF